MVVAVENGLDFIKNHLKNNGYEVVDESYTFLPDAFVYKNSGRMQIVGGNSLSQSTGFERGVLMVNANNKTPDEIIKILENKIYGDFLNFR